MRYFNFLFLFLASLWLIGGAAQTVPASQTRLWAPTYYIAAKATYDGRPDQLYVVGATNLPDGGARLYLNVYRYIGQGGSVINEGASIVVGKGGFFEANLRPSERESVSTQSGL